MHNVSAGGMVLYFITMSFASVDWLMSRDPHWFSTDLRIHCDRRAGHFRPVRPDRASFTDDQHRPRSASRRGEDYFNDLGNLLLTFVIIWAYLSFAQLLVIWMGNKQDEIPWYVQRFPMAGERSVCSWSCSIFLSPSSSC